jgi:glutaryl-CoA dehydrogenase
MPNSYPAPPDYARFDDLLTPDEVALRDRVRAFVQRQVQPRIADCWEAGSFPFEIVPGLASLGVFEELPPVMSGLIAFELERADAGVRSLASVHSHLAQAAIRFFGTAEQRARYLPPMTRGDFLGAFALTEPNHGSDPSGLAVTARPVAGGFRLDGHKRWATNATHAGVTIVWAKVVDDSGAPICEGTRAIRGFLVEAGTPGFRPQAIHRKLSFRVSASSEIILDHCIIPNANVLPEAVGLGAALKCLNEARFGIVWGVAGAAQACFEEALSYAKAREQFGRPIGQFQLTQSKLAAMYGAVTQTMLLALHLGRLKERGALHHTDVSLGKMVNVRHALDVARTARTVLGAIGILDTAVSLRHAANLESEVTYEGTDEVHQLVIGRKLTGLDAFRGD